MTVLSKGEFSLLVVLLGAPHRILSRDQLLDLSRLHNDEVYGRAVDLQVMRLRRKIDEPFGVRSIETVRGVGYRLRSASSDATVPASRLKTGLGFTRK